MRTLKRLSIIQWKTITKHGYVIDKVLKKHPKINPYMPTAYCDKYVLHGCEGCPLNICKSDKTKNGCYQMGHPYKKWFDNHSQKNALDMLKLIKSK